MTLENIKIPNTSEELKISKEVKKKKSHISS